MRITFVVPSRERRGPNIFVNNLVMGLVSIPDLRVQVVYLKSKGDLDYGCPNRQISVRDFFGLRKEDVVQSTMFLPDLVLIGLPLPARKKVVALHNFVGPDVRFTYSPSVAQFIVGLWLSALRFAPNLIYSSRFMESHYRSRQVSGNSRLIEYGVPDRGDGELDPCDVEVFRSLRERGLHIVGDVCLVIARKGLDQLLAVLVHDSSLAVVVVGDGPEKAALEQRAKELGVGDRFFVLGFRKDSYRYNRHFDVFAMVSRSEGFCMAMIEAMSASVPVVCSNLPIYRDMFDAELVPIFELENPDSLFRSLRVVLDNKVHFGLRCRKLFESRFSLPVMAQRHVEFYHSLSEEEHQL